MGNWVERTRLGDSYKSSTQSESFDENNSILSFMDKNLLEKKLMILKMKKVPPSCGVPRKGLNHKTSYTSYQQNAASITSPLYCCLSIRFNMLTSKSYIWKTCCGFLLFLKMCLCFLCSFMFLDRLVVDRFLDGFIGAIPPLDKRTNKLVPDEHEQRHKYTRYSYHLGI